MRRWISKTGVPIMLSTALAIGANGMPLYAMTIPEVIEAVNTLPTIEEVQAMPEEEQQVLYEKLQEVWDAYEALDEKEKAQIEEVKKVEALLEWFNHQTMPLAENTGEDITVLGSDTTGPLSWTLTSDGTLTITGNGEMPNYDNTNPPWYSQKDTITKVVIGDGVTHIGNYAFINCIKLSEIELSDSVTSIGESAFESCTLLTTIELPQVTKVGNKAFSYCSALKTVNFPQVTEIGEYVFYNCSTLQTVKFPKITTIGRNVFSSCSALETVDMQQVTEIGEYAFESCRTLKTVNFPKVTTIGEGAFEYCSALETVDMQQVAEIGQGAFSNCSILKTVNFPQVTTIGGNAFSRCSALETVDMQQVAEIGEYAFSYCSTLKTVNFPQVTTIGGNAFSRCSALETVDMQQVTEIGEYAFSYCSALETVNFPKVTTIGGGAFSDCSALETVDMQQVTKIGNYAFLYCSALKTVNFPQVTTIGTNAFSNCKQLIEIKLPFNAPKLGYNVFIGCDNLTIHIPDGAIGYKADAWWPINQINYGVQLSSEEGGTIEASQNFAKQGDRVNITIKPSAGYEFDKWEVTPSDVTIENNQFTMPADHVVIQGIFKKIPYNITTSSNEGGTVTSSLQIATIGEEVILTVTPSEGYRFKEWQVISGEVTIENNRFTMPARDVEVQAEFEKIPYTITTSSNEGGTLTGSLQTATIGETITLTTEAIEGYRFKEWKVTPSSVVIENNHFTMPADNVTVKAEFEKIPYKITVPTPEGGTITSPETATIGEEVTLTVIPKDGYTFKGWKVISGEITIENNRFIMPAKDVEIQAEFEKIPYMITTSSNEGGTLTSSLQTATIGEMITLTTTIEEGYRFKEWQVTPSSIVITNNQFKMPADHVEIQAVYEKIPTYTITLSKNFEMGGVQSTVMVPMKKGHRLRSQQLQMQTIALKAGKRMEALSVQNQHIRLLQKQTET